MSDPAPEQCCVDGTCPLCEVKAVGARTLLIFLGITPGYDDLDPMTQRHMREAVAAARSDMDQALIEKGFITIRPLKEGVDA